MIDIILNSSYGLVLTLLAFLFSLRLSNKIKIKIIHPLVLTQLIIIGFLVYFKIDYKDYMNAGANIIASFLGPATIVLAVPLFRQWSSLKSNALPILIGVLAGSLTGILSMFFLSKLIGLDKLLNLSLITKSVTTPIAMDITKSLGGVPSITILGVIFAGLIGATIGPKILSIFGITNNIARGIAMGTASHGLGTAIALEEGEVQGAMAGLSVGLTGLTTALIIPFMAKILINFM
ncbi:MAG TPA: LrgB family protein [Eubacteriaceae bacterium]|jgi:predicted murein hydrolase (TIGR00659 family)|nr:LrgB family protein [Eubacteriaceae bacterium]